VTSARFIIGGAGATLKVGDSTLSLSRVNDTTLQATIPGTVAGTFAPRLNVGGQETPLAAITIYGYTETTPYAESMPWDIYVLPDAQHAKVMGGYVENGVGKGLAIIDLDSHQVTKVDGALDVNNQRGPGMTAQSGVYVMRAPGVQTTGAALWQLVPSPVNLGAITVPAGTRQLARLGALGWITTTSHTYSVYSGSTGGLLSSGAAEEVEGIQFSPDGTRASFRVNRIDAGVPVFSLPEGTVAYTTAFQSVQSLDFQNDFLLMAGRTAGTPTGSSRIQVIRASTGVVLRDTTIGLPVSAVALNPLVATAYVAAYGSDNLPVVLVMDRILLKVWGVLKVPSTSVNACFLGCEYGQLAISPQHQLYYFWAFNGTPRAYRFELPLP